jgi:hypothetical protein
MEANCYFHFVNEQNVVRFKLQSQNWQYEPINSQSHDMHVKNSVCMIVYGILDENRLYCA